MEPTLKPVINRLKIGKNAEAKVNQFTMNAQTGQVLLAVEYRASEETNLQDALKLAGKGVADLAGDAVAPIHTAEEKLGKVRKQLADATAAIGNIGGVAATATNRLVQIQKSLDSAIDLQRKKEAALHAATAARDELVSDVKKADERVKELQHNLDRIKKLLEPLEHIVPVPPVHIPRPHWHL